jgi:hypothetical protein
LSSSRSDTRAHAASVFEPDSEGRETEKGSRLQSRYTMREAFAKRSPCRDLCFPDIACFILN